MSLEDEVKSYKNECKKYHNPSREFNSSVFLEKIKNLKNQYTAKFSNDQQNHTEFNRLSSNAIREIFQDTCVKYRYDHYGDIERACGNPVNEVKILMAQNNYLLDTVEELKNEISVLKSEKAEATVLYLQNEHLMESISELKKEVSTLRTMLSYNDNIETFVKVIQRYWRRYLLIKNVKKFAHEYELAMLRDFRKSIVNRESLLHAVESRAKQPVKMSRSNPKNWSVSKAASIAADWNS